MMEGGGGMGGWGGEWEDGGGNGRMGGGWEGECCCFGDHLIY